MGGGSYSRDVPITRMRRSEIFKPELPGQPARREVHKDLNVKGKNRECCDSKEHQETTPIVIAMDVTRSRGEDAVAIYEKMPGLIGRLIMNNIVKEPVISLAAVGDATSGDFAPIQVSQFESDIRIDKALKKIWLEEKGGGTGQESYELMAYFYARHSVLDCIKKKRGKGFFFFLGDEGFYPKVAKDQVKVCIGDDIQGDIPSQKIFQELQKKYDVFFIFPKKSWEERKENIDAEIAQRVVDAGGMVKGVSIRFSILWNNKNDLDAHVKDPEGHHIYYGSHCKSNDYPPCPCGGWLDVDRNVHGETMKPVENIRWEKGKAPKGHYKFFVRNYAIHGGYPAATEFKAELEVDGRVQHFEGETPAGKTGPSSDVIAFEFDYDPAKGLVEEEDKYKLYDDKVIVAQWSSAIPLERILEIEDPRACVDTMIGAIALTKGMRTLTNYLKELDEVIGQTPERCKDVKSALTRLSKVGSGSKVRADVFQKRTATHEKRSTRI